MAAAAPSNVRTTPELRWPSWVLSLSEQPSDDFAGMARHALGHVGSGRTAILFNDARQAAPPIASSDGVALIFDGILYNADDLAKELGAAESPPCEASLLLLAYRRWGEDFVRRLRGLFALIVWDGNRDALLCVRDAMGHYPLFYARSGAGLLVSSSLVDLLRHPSASKELNRAALASYFLDYWPRIKETFYQAVNRIPPGSAMRVEGGGAENIYRWWDPHPPDLDSRWATLEELPEFDRLFGAAIDRFLDFGHPGIFLSGGIDSVSVAAATVDRCIARGLPLPRGLSMVFPHPEANEERIQRGVAEALGIEQDLVPFDVACGPRGLLPPMLELCREMPLPAQNFWSAAYNHIAGLGKRAGCKTIFTGGGGDEWVGVSPYLAADLIRSLDFQGLYNLWLASLRSFADPPLAITRFLFWRFGVRALLRDTAVRRLRSSAPSLLAAIIGRRVRHLAPPWLRIDESLWKTIIERALTSETERANESDRYGWLFAESRRALDHPLISWEMEELFENGRRLGMQRFHPYFDAEVIEMLYRIPPALLNIGGRMKGIVRSQIAQRFPGLGFERQKKVRIVRFFGDIMRREGPQVWGDLGGAKALAALGLVDREEMDRSIAALIASGDYRDAFEAWHIMGMETWLRSRY